MVIRDTKKWFALTMVLPALCVALSVSTWAKNEKGQDPRVGQLSVKSPRRIAEGLDGQILVTDRRYGAIIAVDKESLEPIWSAILPEEGGPFGIAATRRLVFVGNTDTKNVEVYRVLGSGETDTTLDFIYNLGTVPSGAIGSIENPVDLAVDTAEDLVFVLDSAQKRISVFNSRGNYYRSFYPIGGDNLLLSPVALTVDEIRQEVLVADYGDTAPWFTGCSFCSAAEPARIMIFDYFGELLFEIRGDGTTHSSTNFARVHGVSVGPNGRIFAADPLGGRVLVLDRYSGAQLGELGVRGSGIGELMAPLDIWVDPQTGDLFVANNMGARRLEVLRGAGGWP